MACKVQDSVDVVSNGRWFKDENKKVLYRKKRRRSISWVHGWARK